jgi:hypothetical protein
MKKETDSFEETILVNKYGAIWFHVDHTESPPYVSIGLSVENPLPEQPMEWLHLTPRVQQRLHELLEDTTGFNEELADIAGERLG